MKRKKYLNHIVHCKLWIEYINSNRSQYKGKKAFYFKQQIKLTKKLLK